MPSKDDCIFCKIISGAIPARIIAENDHCIAILDAFPAAKGHTLVLTREHRESLHDITPTELAAAAMLVRKAAAGFECALGTSALNVVNNCGATAGQSVQHFHFHLLPRHPGDGLTLPLEHKVTLSPEESEATCVALRDAIART